MWKPSGRWWHSGLQSAWGSNKAEHACPRVKGQGVITSEVAATPMCLSPWQCTSSSCSCHLTRPHTMISSLEITYENNHTCWGSSDLSQNIFTWTEALINLSHTHKDNCIVKTPCQTLETPKAVHLSQYLFTHTVAVLITHNFIL